MEKCLITRLNASVNDASLEKLNCVRFGLEADKEVTGVLLAASGSEITVRLIAGSLTVTDSATQQNIPLPFTRTASGNRLTFKTGTGGAVIEVERKYDVAAMGVIGQFIPTTNVRTLKYMDKLYNINDGVNYGSENGYIGDVTDFVDTLPNLQSITLNRAGCSGEIAHLGKLLRVTSMALQSPDLYGRIEDFVRTAVVAGRTDCTSGNGIQVRAVPGGNKVTFGDGDDKGLTYLQMPMYITWTKSGNTVSINCKGANNYNKDVAITV